MNQKVEKAFLDQMNDEFYSAQLYLSMSSFAQSSGLKGVAHWLRVQYQEEQTHALRFFDYINDRGGRSILGEVEKPAEEWKNLTDLFGDVLKHERKITHSLNKLYGTALEEHDHAALTFLSWFVNEQVEEEANVKDILDQLRLIGDNGSGIFMLDREMAKRVFVATAGDPTV